MVDTDWSSYEDDELKELAYEFNVDGSESNVEIYLRTILKLHGMKATGKKHLQFGYADMLLKNDESLNFVSTVIETKPSSSCDVTKRKIYRAQLAAYMIGAAIQNEKQINECKKSFKCQDIIGVVHIGLTPIFYKTQISKLYLDAVSHAIESEEENISQSIVIEEFTPKMDPFCDREVLFKNSRCVIFKCYAGLKLANAKFSKDKVKFSYEADA